MIHTIYSDTPFDVVFIYIGEPGDIIYQYGYPNILTSLDYMTVFEIVTSIGLKEITSDQVARWYFGNFFVPFGIPKLIVLDADGFFSVMFNNTIQEVLLIPVHVVARGDHAAFRNEGFSCYLKKVQKINSAHKVSLHQLLQGVCFPLYAWNAIPVDGTGID